MHQTIYNVLIFCEEIDKANFLKDKIESAGFISYIALDHSEVLEKLNSNPEIDIALVNFKDCYQAHKEHGFHCCYLTDSLIPKLYVYDNTQEKELFNESILASTFNAIRKNATIEEFQKALLEAKKNNKSLILLNQKFTNIADKLNTGISIINKNFEILYLNKKMKEWIPHIDLTKRNICYQSFKEAHKHSCKDCPCEKSFNDGINHETITNTHIKSKIFNYKIQSNPIKDSIGNVIGIVEIVEDFTEKVKLAGANKTINTLRSILENAYDSIITIDRQFRITSVNQSAQQLFGYKEDELLNNSFNTILDSETSQLPEIYVEGDSEYLATGLSLELTGLTKSEKKIPIELSYSSYPTTDGLESVCIIRDLTEKKKQENKIKKLNEQLKEMAYKDALTRTYNRNSIIDLIEKNIKRAERKENKLALIFVDIDNFKDINDLCGHNTGDKVLKDTATIIKNTIREDDFVGRIGGDEFIICIYDIKSQINAIAIANKILNRFSNEIILENYTREVKASAGIALYPDNGTNAEDLINKSDNAMYWAKEEEENACMVYDSYKDNLNKFFAINNALKNNEFRLYYQPIVNKNGQVEFIEALLRWENEKYGICKPDEIFPFLKRNKQLKEIEKWSLNNILKDIYNINKDERFKNLIATFNLSCEEIVKRNFISELKDILQENKDTSLNNFMIEITEWGYNFNVEDTDLIEKIKEIKKSGIKLFLDDFGAGYSSFKNIVKFPVDIIKIDMSLIHNLDSQEYSILVLDLIPTIKKLKYKIVAEGVETKYQFDKLASAGCDYFQGYYFSEPVYKIQNLLNKTNGVLKGNDLNSS